MKEKRKKRKGQRKADSKSKGARIRNLMTFVGSAPLRFDAAEEEVKILH